MAGLASINFGGLGGAVADIFGGIGDKAEAKAYGEAASIAENNAQLAKEAGAIQAYQAQRQIYQTIGGQRSDVAGAGFAESGSSLDLLRSSAQQGALTKQLIGVQTNINVQGYQQEAAAYKGMQGAANAASSGGIFGGILKGIGSIFGL